VEALQSEVQTLRADEQPSGAGAARRGHRSKGVPLLKE
jgi:hypothetical protein